MKPIDTESLYRDGLHYDAQHVEIVEDIPFYLSRAQKCGGLILELACGTGRLTIPLARQGFDITGLDISDAMLKVAREKAKREHLSCTFIKADCREFSISGIFNLIFIPFNSIAHIHDRASFEALCQAVKNHLAPDGRFIVDMFNPRLERFMSDPNKRYAVAEYEDPYGHEKVTITENNVYDKKTQINHIKWYYKIGKKEEFSVELNMRIYFPQELDNLLYYNGLEIIEKYGDFDGSPFESNSPKQLIVCKKSKLLK